MTTALLVLLVALGSLALLGYTVHLVFRDTPGPESTPPRSHAPETFSPPWDLAA